MNPREDRRVVLLETELARVRREFELALEAVPADRLHRAPQSQWTPAQLIWHLAKVERGVARMIERLDAALPPMVTVPPGPRTEAVLHLLDKFSYSDRSRRLVAPEAIRPPESIDLPAERERWTSGRVHLFGVIRAVGPRLSLLHQDHPFFGPFDGWQWTLMIARHEERHLLQLREVVAASL